MGWAWKRVLLCFGTWPDADLFAQLVRDILGVELEEGVVVVEEHDEGHVRREVEGAGGVEGHGDVLQDLVLRDASQARGHRHQGGRENDRHDAGGVDLQSSQAHASEPWEEN